MTAAPAAHHAVQVRGGTLEDVPLILSSWMKSYRRGATAIPSPIFDHYQRETILKLLQRSRILVATLPEDAAYIMGYVVAEEVGGVCVVHYAYTKQPFRRLGIAGHLLHQVQAGTSGVQHTHATQAGAALARRLRSAFNPYLAGVRS